MKLAIAICLATTFLTVGNPMTSLARLQGKLNGVSETTIRGYCYEETYGQNQALQVDLIISDYETMEEVERYTVSANEIDEGDRSGDYLKIYHNFSYDMDWTTLQNGTYLVQAEVNGKKLPGSKTYTNTNGIKEQEEVEETHPQEQDQGKQSLGVFKVTAYCPCTECSDNWGRKTSTGVMARANHTIAVDPRVIPYRTKILIGNTVYTAEDRGGLVKGNHIDMFFDTHAQVNVWGKKYMEVFRVN